MYQYPLQYPQYPQYPLGYNYPTFGQPYASLPQNPPQIPSGPYVPQPQNFYAFTRETLLKVLEKLSELIDAEFRGVPIRLVAHGGACILLHPGLHTIAERRATHSGFIVEAQRFTTRDVDYIHRSFTLEYERQGVSNAGERLKRVIYDTATQMGHEFRLGADWMNSDADAGLPIHEDPTTGVVSDPVYDGSITPENARRNTVYVSPNRKLTIICIPPAWAVALKLHRYSLKDLSDICLWLIHESRNLSITWDVESVKHWIESECPDMNYKNFDRQRLIQRRKRIERVLTILSSMNDGHLEYNIDQVQAFLPDGKTGIQPPGAALPDPRPVSTNRFQIGATIPDAGRYSNRNQNIAEFVPPRHHTTGQFHHTQLSSNPVPQDISSSSVYTSQNSRSSPSYMPERSRERDGRGRRLNSADFSDSESSDDDSSEDSESEEEPVGDSRRPTGRWNTANAGSSTRHSVIIQEPPPEILSVEEQAARQMARMIVHDRPSTPYSHDSSHSSHRQSRHGAPPNRQHSLPVSPTQTSQTNYVGDTAARSGSTTPYSSHRQYSLPPFPQGQGQISQSNLDSDARRSRSRHRTFASRQASPARESGSTHQRQRSPSPFFIPPLPTEEFQGPFQKSWHSHRPRY